MSETKDEILKDLEKKGLAIAEDQLEKVVNSVFDIVEKKIIESKNKYDDLALGVLKKVRQFLLNRIDAIDKSDNKPQEETEK